MKPHPTLTPDQVDAVRAMANFAARNRIAKGEFQNDFRRGVFEGCVCQCKLLVTKFQCQNFLAKWPNG